MTRRSLSVLVLVLAVAGCGGSSDAKGPTATVGSPKTTEPTTTTTAKPATPEAEVEAAYLKSWDVYAKAVRELDDSHLDEVYAEPALDLRRKEVARLKAANTPVRISVKHNYTFQLYGDQERALVAEAYENHSVLLDPRTGEPTEADPDEVLRRQYQMRRIDGTWKVVDVLDAG